MPQSRREICYFLPQLWWSEQITWPSYLEEGWEHGAMHAILGDTAVFATIHFSSHRVFLCYLPYTHITHLNVRQVKQPNVSLIQDMKLKV